MDNSKKGNKQLKAFQSHLAKNIHRPELFEEAQKELAAHLLALRREALKNRSLPKRILAVEIEEPAVTKLLGNRTKGSALRNYIDQRRNSPEERRSSEKVDELVRLVKHKAAMLGISLQARRVKSKRKEEISGEKNK